MIDSLITSKTRVKLLLKFFLNPENSAYLRGLESEFDESSNSIRMELNKLESAKMLESSLEGNRKLYKVNCAHPLYNEINSIVRKYFGLDVIVESILKKLGHLEAAYLTGEIAKGRDVGIVDLVFVGEINRQYMIELIEKAEKLIHRKIRFLHYSAEEFEKLYREAFTDLLLIWKR